jgi:hypothetical protein
MKTMRIMAVLCVVVSLTGKGYGKPDLQVLDGHCGAFGGGEFLRAGCGTSYTASVSARNAGTTGSDAFHVNVDLIVWVAGSARVYRHLTSLDFGPLAAGDIYYDRVSGVLSLPTDIPGGQYYAMFTIDPDNEIDESNEANNTYITSNYLSTAVFGYPLSNVVGLTKEAAEAQVRADGFTLGRTWYGYSDTVPEGVVMGEQPEGGKSWWRDCITVELTISQGPEGGPVGPGVPSTGSLVGHWKLDETTGTIAADSSGSNLNGTLFGGPVWQPTGGKIGGALKFDGIDDYVQLPIGSTINALTDSTFTTWVNWSGVGVWTRVFDFGSGTNSYMFLTPRTDTGFMRFAITNAGNTAEDMTTAPQVLATGWHHVAVTIDAASKSHLLYLDGQVVATKTSARYTPSSLGNTTQNWLGRAQYVADPYFNGSLDDLRIYNCALTASEIAQLAGTGDPNLVGWWKLDETTGTIAADSSGHDLNGTLFGGPLWQPTGGKLNGALQFDGVNDYVDCGNDPSLNITSQITVAAWVKPVDASSGLRNKQMIGKGGWGYYLQQAKWDSGEHLVEFVIHDGDWYGAGTFITSSFDGQWHHLAGAYDGARIKLYIDGQLKTTTDHVGRIDTSAASVNIGRVSDWPDNCFGGTIDDARIYNRALSAQEIQQCMLGEASAASSAIPVENFSFELPGTAKVKGWDGACSDPAWTGLKYDIPGWRSDSPAFDSGVETGQTPTDGLWTAFLKSGDPAVWQLTDHTIAAGEVFDLKVDARSNSNATTLLMVLCYDNAGVRIPAAIQAASVTSTMQELTLTLNAAYVPASVGKKIGVELTNVSPDPGTGSYIGLDNVRLTLVP